MVALPHTDKEPCQCLRCQPRIVVNYMTTVNGKPVGVVAEIGTGGCDFLVKLLQASIDVIREHNDSAPGEILAIEHLQAIFRRQVPPIAAHVHGGQANG